MLIFYIFLQVKPLAVVGNDTITTEMFLNFYHPQPNVNRDSLKQAVLDKLINEKLLFIAATNEKLDTLVEKQLKDFEARLIIGKLYDYIVDTNKTKPTLWEIRREWWQTGLEVDASIILVSEKAKLDTVLNELRKGKPFDAVAMSYSEHFTSKKGGSLGRVKWGQMEPELQKVIFSLSEGKISKPVKTVRGYYIVKVNKRIKVDRPVFDETQIESIKRRLTATKQRIAAEKYLDHIRSISHIKYNQTAIDKIIKYGENLEPKERELNIVRWVGGSLTVSDFLKEVGCLSCKKFNKPEEIKNWINNWLTMKFLLPITARRYGFDKLYEVKRQIKERQERMLIDEYKKRQIEQVSKPTDEESFAYFKSHLTDKYIYEEKKAKKISKSEKLLREEFEKIKSRVAWDLEQERRNEKEKSIIDSLKNEIPVKIFEDNLVKVKK